MERGDALFAEGDYEKARVEYRNVLQIDQQDIAARFALGETMSRLQDYREAAGQYQAVLEVDPGHAGANERLGELYLRAGDAAQAQSYADVLLQADAGSADGLTLRAGVKALQNDMVGARNDIDQALAIEPTHINATGFLARLLLNDGQTDEALAVLESAAATHSKNVELRTMLAALHAQQGDTSNALNRFRENIAIEPTKFSHRLTLARYLTGIERVDDAEEVLKKALADNPEDLTAKLAYIDFLASQQTPAIAIDELRRMIDERPQAYDLRFALARIYSVQQDWPGARQVFTDIISDAEPDSPVALTAQTRLAAVAIQQGAQEEGLSLINAVLSKNARDKDALTLRGSMALENNDPASAIADFRSALRDDPNDLALLRLLARAHLANGEAELGKDTLRTAIDAHPADLQVRAELAQVQARENDVDGAIKTLEEMLTVQPGHKDTLQALYRARAFKQDWDGALDVAERVQQAFPEDPLGFHLAGLVYQAQQDFKASLGEFESALAISPDAIQPLSQLIKSHLALDQRDVAEARLIEVIEHNERNFVAHNLVGELQFARKEYASARSSFTKAIELNSKWEIPYRNLANAYLAEADSANAVATMEQGISATDGSTLLVTAYASYMEQQGDLDTAIRQYDSLLAKDPNSELAANNLAMLLIEYRDDAESVRRARELTDRFSEATHPAYLDTVGWVAYKAGEYDKAVGFLKRAVEAAPDSNILRYHLGMAYMAQGNSIDALDNLRQSVAAGENFRGIDEARKAIEALGAG